MDGRLTPTFAAADITSVIVIVGILAAVIVITTVGLLIFRRKMLEMSRSGIPTQAGIMESMRQMHEQGSLSDTEFAAIRAKMAVKVRTESPAKKPNNPNGTRPVLDTRTTAPASQPKPRQRPAPPPSDAQ